jgi:hypothetical protein
MSYTATFEEIESRAESTMAVAIFARQARDGLLAYTIGAPLLHFLVAKLDSLYRDLRTASLDTCDEKQLHEIADALRDLDKVLLKLVDAGRDSRLNSFRTLRNLLAKIEARTEDLESIIENINLAANPAFHKVVSSAIEKLELGVEDRATLLR